MTGHRKRSLWLARVAFSSALLACLLAGCYGFDPLYTSLTGSIPEPVIPAHPDS